MSFIKDMSAAAMPQIDALLANPETNGNFVTIQLLFGMIDNDQGGISPEFAAQLAMCPKVSVTNVEDAVAAAELLFAGYRIVKMTCNGMCPMGRGAMIEGCRVLSVEG